MENNHLTEKEQLASVSRRFNIDTDIINEQLSDLPTMELVAKAVQYYKVHKSPPEFINKVIVLPGGVDKHGNNTKPVLFGSDTWSVEWDENIYRKINFGGLNSRIQFECKIICVAELWLLTRRSKLNSLIRKCSQITIIANFCQKHSVLSIFHLSSDLNAELLKLTFMKNMSTRSFKNYIGTLNTLTELSDTPLGALGFCCKKNFTELNEEDDSNQTYCMPFSIFSKNWLAFKDYFDKVDSEFVDIASHILDSLWEYIHATKEKRNFSSKSKHWYKYISRPETQAIFKKYHEKFPEDALVNITSMRDPSSGTQSGSSEKYWSNIKKLGIEYRLDVSKFLDKITSVFMRMRMALQAYTGMRYSEALYIQFNSLVDDKLFGYVGIDSMLTKYAGEGGIKAIWAAPPWCIDIFEVGIKLAKKVYQDLNVGDILKLNVCLNVREYIYNERIKVTLGKANTTLHKTYTNLWADEIDLYISEEEVQEFYLLNRNLKSPEKVRAEVFPGALWPLRSHQYRRSIAVHCKRLSLVGGQELSFQLKHMQRTQTDWYGDGGPENSIYKRIASQKLKHIWDKEFSNATAEKSVEIQSSETLFGKGGKLLMTTKDKPDSAKVYPSLKKAKSMAARSKSELKALGNGMYCLNGQNCKMESIIQNSTCNSECENFVGEKEAINFWKKRYEYYGKLIDKTIGHKNSEAQIEYLRLEQNSYKEMLQFCGVYYE